ncbi:hypothetical protein SNE40_017478 [Patella caerulea]|uniref:Uncharacterized protein n=1 Tax=Patella caerulea TaxID=87958 RepID=A0AAN8P9S8_PATCE
MSEFKSQMKAKRTSSEACKKDTSYSKILKDESIVVQRMSALVSGKAQKYTRIGAREFVPFQYEDVCIDNIKTACIDHFNSDEICDVLAGEHGPSCFHIGHIGQVYI